MLIKRIIILTFLSFFAFIFTSACEKSYKVASGYQAERLKADNGSFREITINGMATNGSGNISWRQIAGAEVELSNSDTMNPRFTPRKGDVYKFELTIGKGKKTSSGLMTVEVINSSSFIVYYPVRSKYIAVTVPVITYKGFQTEIKSIYALNKTTGAKFEALMSKGSFTIPDIPLTLGDNIIDIVATDLADYTITQQYVAVYNKDVNFLSSPTFGNFWFAEDEDVVTSVSIQIADYEGMQPGQVRLAQVDDSYTIIKDNIAILYDNGDVTNGDDIAQDGVYSSKIVFEKLPAGVYKFRVIVDHGGGVYSAPGEVTSIVPLNVKGYVENSKLADEIINKYMDDGSGWFESYLLNINKIIDELFLYPQVSSVSVSNDCRVFNVNFSEGGSFPSIMYEMKDGNYVYYDFKKNNLDQSKLCGYIRANPNTIIQAKKATAFPGRISDGKGLNLSVKADNSEAEPALDRPLSERELKERERNKGREILRQPTIDGYPSDAISGKRSSVQTDYLLRSDKVEEE